MFVKVQVTFSPGSRLIVAVEPLFVESVVVPPDRLSTQTRFVRSQPVSPV